MARFCPLRGFNLDLGGCGFAVPFYFVQDCSLFVGGNLYFSRHIGRVEVGRSARREENTTCPKTHDFSGQKTSRLIGRVGVKRTMRYYLTVRAGKAIDLFSLYILFSQFRPREVTLGNCFFQLPPYARAHVRMIFENTKGKFPWEYHVVWNGKTKMYKLKRSIDNTTENHGGCEASDK